MPRLVDDDWDAVESRRWEDLDALRRSRYAALGKRSGASRHGLCTGLETGSSLRGITTVTIPTVGIAAIFNLPHDAIHIRTASNGNYHSATSR